MNKGGNGYICSETKIHSLVHSDLSLVYSYRSMRGAQYQISVSSNTFNTIQMIT